VVESLQESVLTTADMSKTWTEMRKANAIGFHQFEITTTYDNIYEFSYLGTTHTTFEMKKQFIMCSDAQCLLSMGNLLINKLTNCTNTKTKYRYT